MWVLSGCRGWICLGFRALAGEVGGPELVLRFKPFGLRNWLIPFESGAAIGLKFLDCFIVRALDGPFVAPQKFELLAGVANDEGIELVRTTEVGIFPEFSQVSALHTGFDFEGRALDASGTIETPIAFGHLLDHGSLYNVDRFEIGHKVGEEFMKSLGVFAGKNDLF